MCNNLCWLTGVDVHVQDSGGGGSGESVDSSVRVGLNLEGSMCGCGERRNNPTSPLEHAKSLTKWDLRTAQILPSNATMVQHPSIPSHSKETTFFPQMNSQTS
jgi:hypothetical protein